MIIQEETVDLETAKGPMRTYVYRPVAPGKYPGLIFYSEIFQQTEPIRRAATVLAGHGYVVLVPEVFHELNPIGTVLAYDQPGKDKGNQDKLAKSLEDHDADVETLVAYLSGLEHCTGKIGAMGVCIGGHLAFRAAMHEKILATSCLYATDIHSSTLPAGEGQDSLTRSTDIKGELQMIFGKQDPHVPGEGRALIYKTLTEAGVVFTWHEFNAQHAFIRDEGDRYDPEVALTCYRLALALFHRKLGEGDVMEGSENKVVAQDC